jgi:hypothetical protein
MLILYAIMSRHEDEGSYARAEVLDLFWIVDMLAQDGGRDEQHFHPVATPGALLHIAAEK